MSTKFSNTSIETHPGETQVWQYEKESKKKKIRENYVYNIRKKKFVSGVRQQPLQYCLSNTAF